MNDRLEQLLKKREQLENQIQKIKNEHSTRKRKDETRRKILIGAMVLKSMEKDPKYAAQVLEQLERFLVKQGDRALFDLKPLPSSGQDQ